MIIRSYLHSPGLATPSVIGLSLNDAFIQLSNHNLNMRLLDLKEDSDLPEGTVIKQLPVPNQLIKPRQTIFLALSKRPAQQITPNLLGNSKQYILNTTNKLGVKLKIFPIESIEPAGTCVGQIPAPGKILDIKTITVYLSQTTPKPVIWPNFIGAEIHTVLDFLAPYQLQAHVTKNTNRSTTITDQRPLPGSIVHLEQKPYIQFHICLTQCTKHAQSAIFKGFLETTLKS